MIKVECLNKYYNKGKNNELHVIDNTSLLLNDTGLVCILGESGSGKTTLMNTISGLDDFVGGTIQVDDTTVSKYGSKEQEHIRNEKFGYIFQNYYLLQDRTVEYNIMLALSLYEISEQEKKERIDYVLKAVDMYRYKKRLISQLSGGQQQRIAIARALAKTPKVIFADEPTGNLDEVNTMRIMSILKKISQDCLVVVVTHEKSIAEFFADRIIWISDGKIQKDQEKTSQGTYQYSDDTNIYLQEYEKKEYQNGSVKIETYSNQDILPLEIKLIYENGKIYLYAPDNSNIEYLTLEDEKQVIDGKRPHLEMDDLENMEYSLEPLQTNHSPKLSFKEIFQMAKSNIATMGKKQIFLILSLLVMSVLIVLTVQDIMTILDVNKKEIITKDSHYLNVKVAKNAMIRDGQYEEAYRKLLEQIKGKGGDIYVNPSIFVSYQYDGFWQLESVKSNLQDYSLVTLEHLKESDLIYGVMPKEPYEVVVDRWVLESFMNQDTEIAHVIPNVRHFLGRKLVMQNKDVELTIVGISDTGQPSVYVDKLQGVGLSSWCKTVTSLEELQKAYPGEYDDVKLEPGEALILESEYDHEMYQRFNNMCAEYKWYQEVTSRDEMLTQEKIDDWLREIESMYNVTYEQYLEVKDNPKAAQKYLKAEDYEKTIGFGKDYQVKGYFTDDYRTEVVISAEDYEDLVWSAIINFKEFNLYTDNKSEMKEYLKELAESNSDLNITVIDNYEDQMSLYMQERQIKFDARIIITVTIFVVSLIILYFMMKANAVRRMGDLGVYRLLGISKHSIIGLFAVENFLITSYTSLIGVILTTAVTKFISNVPALGMEVIFPWYAFWGTVVFLYLVNMGVGVLPIRKILKLPPAQLATKYDV